MKIATAVFAILVCAGPALGAERAKPKLEPFMGDTGCREHGPGFARLSGTQTCVKVSGRVRMETGVGSARSRSQDAVSQGGAARLDIDTRTQTEYGPVRVFVGAGNDRRR